MAHVPTSACEASEEEGGEQAVEDEVGDVLADLLERVSATTTPQARLPPSGPFLPIRAGGSPDEGLTYVIAHVSCCAGHVELTCFPVKRFPALEVARSGDAV